MSNNEQDKCPLCNKMLAEDITRLPVCYLHPRCEICYKYTFKNVCSICKFTLQNKILECKVCKRFTTYNICFICKKRKININ